MSLPLEKARLGWSSAHGVTVWGGRIFVVHATFANALSMNMVGQEVRYTGVSTSVEVHPNRNVECGVCPGV